jgi:excisionase family DNA binding protein
MDEKDILGQADSLPEGLQFVTYEEAAIILRVQRATICSWVYRGDIRSSIRMGRKALIPISELRRFVAEKTKMREHKVFPLRNSLSRKVVPPPSSAPAAEQPTETAATVPPPEPPLV